MTGQDNELSRRTFAKRTALLGTALVGATWLNAPPAAADSRDRQPPGNEPVPPQVPVREGVVELPGASLWYWDTGGSGPAIVLLHAGTGSALSWPYQQPVFARAGFRVIGYSRRGHHRSSAVDPADPGISSEDLLALVDALGIETFHALGVAAGGITALDFAVSYPERLRCLIIASSIFLIQEPEFLSTIEGLRPAEFNALPVAFKELSPAYRAVNPDGVAQWLDIYAQSIAGGGRQGLANQTTWADLERLKVKSLLMTGDADLYMPPPMLRTIGEHMPRSRVVVIPEAGHSPHWEQPRAFNRAVVDFL